MFRRPYVFMAMTLSPLVVSTLFLYINLSRVMQKEMATREVQIRQSQTAQIVDELRVRVDAAWDIVDHYCRENLGQQACRHILGDINVNQDGYIYVQQMDTPAPGRATIVVHPDRNFVGDEITMMVDLDRVSSIYYHGKIYPLDSPEIAGISPTNVSTEVNRVCREDGAGIIHYFWAKVIDGQASDVGYPKIAYIRYFPQWKWAIGSGAYADHIDTLVGEQLQVAQANAGRVWDLIMSSTLVVALLLGLISLVVSKVFARQANQYERFLLESQEQLSQEVNRSRKSEQVIKTLINNLPQKVVLKDRNSIITCCNETYAQGLNRTVDEIIGKSERELYPQEVADGYLKSDREVMDQGKSIEMFSRLRVDGEEIVTRVLKTAVRTNEAEVDGVLCVFEDFTQRIRNEENLRAANVELEEANQQLQETQAQLVQSEKLASIGQLAAGIAHEINNPMCYVVGNCDLLQEYITNMIRFITIYDEHVGTLAGVPDRSSETSTRQMQEARSALDIDHICTDIQDLISDSQEGMNRVLKIVRNLRSFSRVDQPHDVMPYNLNEGIQSTLTIASNELSYKACVTTELDDIPDVPCNAGQINQVLLNILVNAAQALGSQERPDLGNILVRTCCEEDFVVCMISDDGPGIEPENLTKIFDPFFTTKPTGQGTGLGLNVSYDIIVNKHGGELSVDSEPGQGTTFTIKIPIDGRAVDNSREEHTHEPQDSSVC